MVDRLEIDSLFLFLFFGGPATCGLWGCWTCVQGVIRRKNWILTFPDPICGQNSKIVSCPRPCTFRKKFGVDAETILDLKLWTFSTHTIVRQIFFLAYSIRCTATAAKDTLPPSCRRHQAGRCRCRAATATLLLPTLPPRCCCRQRCALAKLPPLLPSWLPPLTPRSCQAARATTKLAAAPALSQRFHSHHVPFIFIIIVIAVIVAVSVLLVDC